MSTRSVNQSELTGRELDAKVAEVIMGIPIGPTQPIETPESHANSYGPCDGFLDGECFVCAGSPSRPNAYSSDHNAAMQVVEAMEKRGWRWSISDGGAGSNYYEAAIWYKDNYFEEKAQTISDLPRAICIAALRAVEMEGENP